MSSRASIVGASNSRPHGQIWATEHVPNEPAKEALRQEAYLAGHQSRLLANYLALELAVGERLVCANDQWVALVPFWAFWPFETLLLPRHHAASLPELTDDQCTGLAAILKRLITRYDTPGPGMGPTVAASPAPS